MTYKTKFRCRLCGATYYSGCTGNKDIAVSVAIETAHNGHSKSFYALGMVEPHACSNGSIGIADFQGFEAFLDEDENPLSYRKWADLQPPPKIPTKDDNNTAEKALSTKEMSPDDKTLLSAYVRTALHEACCKGIKFPDNVGYIADYLIKHGVTAQTETPPKEHIKGTETPQKKTCNNCRHNIDPGKSIGIGIDQPAECVCCVTVIGGGPSNWEPKE